MSQEVTAPMAGKVWKIQVKAGAEVQAEDELIILEAMKMEIPIYAEAAGKVSEIKVAEEADVEANQVLMVLD